MASKEYLDLLFADNTRISIRPERYAKTKEELEDFLMTQKHMHTKTFAKDVMFSHELKANNQIEGYGDDVKFVKEVIEKKLDVNDPEVKNRIINLYRGYNFILRKDCIDKESLRRLYAILSKDLLKSSDYSRMGQYYRQAPVYILQGGRIDMELDEGLEYSLIDKFMDEYFNFLNNADYSASLTDEYIKSQILHFYFVYIHPYFDVNGRTSRTLAMWYLLNKKAYPYIIFNRGINFQGQRYDKTIIDVKKFHDISFFIDFMLKTVQVELEKEYIMQAIASNTSSKLSSEDYQTMLYLLSMNGLLTVNDYTAVYNRFHDKKKSKEVYESMISPLISKGVLEVERQTNGIMFGNYPNMVIGFNPSVMDYDKDQIRLLTRYK